MSNTLLNIILKYIFIFVYFSDMSFADNLSKNDQ